MLRLGPQILTPSMTGRAVPSQRMLICALLPSSTSMKFSRVRKWGQPLSHLSPFSGPSLWTCIVLSTQQEIAIQAAGKGSEFTEPGRTYTFQVFRGEESPEQSPHASLPVSPVTPGRGVDCGPQKPLRVSTFSFTLCTPVHKAGFTALWLTAQHNN